MLFSESQIKAIQHNLGPALVLAGPGSGKTSVIINRLKFLIEDKNINPGNILVSTFSRAAAFEMKSRFLKLTKGSFPSLTFATIHSISYSILRESPKYQNYSLISEKQKSHILKSIIEKLYKYYDNSLFRELSLGISYIKTLKTMKKILNIGI